MNYKSAGTGKGNLRRLGPGRIPYMEVLHSAWLRVYGVSVRGCAGARSTQAGEQPDLQEPTHACAPPSPQLFTGLGSLEL